MLYIKYFFGVNNSPKEILIFVPRVTPRIQVSSLPSTYTQRMLERPRRPTMSKNTSPPIGRSLF